MKSQKTEKSQVVYSKCFTLIELMIVISIIAILAGMLLPTLSKAREKARLAYCQNNLKNLGLGMIQYADDNKNILPNLSSSGTEPYSWTMKIAPYVGYDNDKGPAIFHCPSGSSRNLQLFKIRSYAQNDFTATTKHGMMGLDRRDSLIFMLVETWVSGTFGERAVTSESRTTVTVTTANGGDLALRHSGSLNLVRKDGSVHNEQRSPIFPLHAQNMVWGEYGGSSNAFKGKWYVSGQYIDL